jgi:hypothetical protein
VNGPSIKGCFAPPATTQIRTRWDMTISISGSGSSASLHESCYPVIIREVSPVSSVEILNTPENPHREQFAKDVNLWSEH